MTGPTRTQRLLSHFRFGRRSGEERQERLVKKAQQLEAMKGERGRVEGGGSITGGGGGGN